jgi:hypothetical protein
MLLSMQFYKHGCKLWPDYFGVARNLSDLFQRPAP